MSTHDLIREPHTGGGRHTALIVQVAWWRVEHGDYGLKEKLATNDMIIQAVIDPFTLSSFEDIDKAVSRGVNIGVTEFNHYGRVASLMGIDAPPLPATSSKHVRGARLASWGFDAVRDDIWRGHNMSEIHMSRAAITILSALSTELKKIGEPTGLGWDYGQGTSSFHHFQSHLENASRQEKLGKTSPFPHADYPELARRMEQLDLGVVTATSKKSASHLRL